MENHRFETEFAGKKVIIESGRLALQASASVTVQMGGTVVLATVMMSNEAREVDFLPLMVDYEERYFAAGRIKGPRFSKREGKPSAEAMLIGRMIDRGLRPQFPQDMRNDIQIICLPLSLDYENKPDIAAILAAATAIHISEIPFDGPIAGVRISLANGHYLVNPTADELEFSDLNLVVMGDGDRITMVDCDANEVPDEDVARAFKIAMETMGPMASFMEDIRNKIGKPKATGDQLILKGEINPEDKEIIEDIKKAALSHLDEYLFNTPIGSKGERKAILHNLEDILVEEFKAKLVTPERDEEAAKEHVKGLLGGFFWDFIEEQVTLAILERDLRVDGRKLDQLRPLSSEVGVLPRTHGSGLFSRGETQILSVLTLGAPFDELSIETMENDGVRKYFHHYNFLPYCVGEVKPIRGAGRREIGHGALAEKALGPVLPTEEDFPYTIRVVSEVMASNGSSSMAATCGSSLALMDAGVPIKKHVAGIGMGLASNGKKWKIVTDLQDLEDGKGGMDFKFTSTRDGITAIQMETKTRGLSYEIISATFPQMRKAIYQILDSMEQAILVPREELSPYAPRIISFMVDPQKIGDIIGPGGKIIRAITDELDLKIDINDDGLVLITTTDVEKGKQAEDMIRDIVRVVEVGDIFDEAEVVKIMPFGAFVNLTSGTDGMLHVSELEWGRVEKVTDRVNLGDKVRVKVIKIDNGKVDVSMKALLPKPKGYVDSRRGGRRGYKKSAGRGGARGGMKREPNMNVGDIFDEAEVVNIMSFGAFVRLTPDTDGLLHISEIEWGRVEKVTDRLRLGDKVKVKVIRIERGKVNVSMKALLPKP
ncbi:MAG: polyribonucleotide nucleotidyltransferase [Thermoplasmata archaeon]|nr:MAG: polyribonucleotide nucleotidyltransferase [Thermoplasmata archaeon]